MAHNSGIPRVAFLGPENTYTHIVARDYFGEDAESLPEGTFKVCKSVRHQETDYGVLPVENNSVGFVDATLDALYATDRIRVFDEVYLPIHHQLISNARSIKDVKRVYSHAQAFSQCRRTLERLELRAGGKFSRMVIASTALGAEIAADEEGAAAIASKEAAERLGLAILEGDIEDRRDNTTRFWVVTLGDVPPPTGQDRTAFLVELEHRPGTVARMLNLFAEQQLNMVSLQTRPIGTEKGSGRWEYAFFLEYEGHINDEGMATVYSILKSGRSGIQRHDRSTRLLGSYPNRNAALDLPS